MSKDDAYGRYEAGTIRWTECEDIERSADQYAGAWRFRNTDIPLTDLFQALANGTSTTEFAAAHETAHTRPSPRRVLRFLADQVEEAYEATWEHGGPERQPHPCSTAESTTETPATSRTSSTGNTAAPHGATRNA